MIQAPAPFPYHSKWVVPQRYEYTSNVFENLTGVEGIVRSERFYSPQKETEPLKKKAA